MSYIFLSEQEEDAIFLTEVEGQVSKVVFRKLRESNFIDLKNWQSNRTA